ncbi:DUF6233 domain-containing protein [Streptomyces sp. NPDC088733]|uniref:DUF6233 domain-containing protein n=1 Tax=Streptomyces sp. NPDC088733 TaxID=3365880 RepID=UPI0038005C33
MPSPVRFWAPAPDCSPVAGQDYSTVPSDWASARLSWSIEHRVDVSEADRYLVHRGDCRAGNGDHRPVDDGQAQAALCQRGAIPCPVCRPDRVLL